MSDCDVVIAGGGHNGLACGAFLTLHGLKVVVVGAMNGSVAARSRASPPCRVQARSVRVLTSGARSARTTRTRYARNWRSPASNILG
jgi:glycine/D-amino acid oxidase-like deaminating enzyme